MNPTRPMIIVGAGHVGGRAAAALREFGWTGPIELIGREPHAPYERPPLSKDLLTGARSPADCRLRAPDEDARDGIHRRVATVRSLDTAARELELEDGQRLGYEALLLATGGAPRRLATPGARLRGVLDLRTLDDAQALAPRLREGAHLVIVGGGFIGLEVAASARACGCRVTLIEHGPRLLGRAVPAVLADAVLALHRAHGVELRLGEGPELFTPLVGGAVAVTLSDGRSVPADTVVVGIGIEPSTELARAAGLQVGRGIVVNAELESSVPGVFAAGDVAEFPSVLSGALIRQETWHNAETQARTAARNMLGQHQAYTELPWFWSDQYDHQLQVAGEPALAVDTVSRDLGEAAGGARAQLHFHRDASGRLVGASGFGPTSTVVRELKLARLLVERRAVLPPEMLGDASVKLKGLLAHLAA